MKRYGILLLLFASVAYLQAQIIIGYDPFQVSGKALWELNDLRYVKSTKTIFVLPRGSDSATTKMMRAIVAQKWLLTPFQIVSADELMNLRDVPGYSFFHLSRVIINTRRAGGKMEWGRMFCWRFWTVRHFEQGLNVQVPLAFSMVQPAPESFQAFTQFDSMADRRNVLRFLHDSMAYPGILPHIFSQQLSFLQRRLLKGDKVSHLKIFSEKAQLKNLRKRTLWIPSEYLLGADVQLSPAKETVNSFQDQLKKYKATFRLLPIKELDEKIGNGELMVYLQLTRNGYQWVVSVWEAPTGILIYQRTYYEDSSFGPRTFIEDLNKAMR